jgi:DNA-binding Lrp family transcriptional regulator
MLDDIDGRLIAELRRDGRAALSDLATRLGISRATVRSRMERLVERGEIAGFTVLTRGDVSPAPVRALMLIGIEGRGAERIMARLTGLPAVLAVHSTNGRWDLIAELGTQTLAELDEVIFRIRGIEGVMTSETNLLLGTRKAGRRG